MEIRLLNFSDWVASSEVEPAISSEEEAVFWATELTCSMAFDISLEESLISFVAREMDCAIWERVSTDFMTFWLPALCNLVAFEI